MHPARTAKRATHAVFTAAMYFGGMKVSERAEKLLDEGVDLEVAVERLIAEAPVEEKVEWFDQAAAKYLVYQLQLQRQRNKD